MNSVRVMEGEGGEAKFGAVAVWRESQLFTGPERVALEFAERMTITGQKIDDALFARLKQHYTEAQIVELAGAIALENFRSKFNPALAASRGLPSRAPIRHRSIKLFRQALGVFRGLRSLGGFARGGVDAAEP